MDRPFIIVWDDGHFSTETNETVSNMYDMADCDAMDGIVGVYSLDRDNQVVTIRLGTEQRYETDDDEYLFHYGYKHIYAGSRRVGTVYLTDH